MKEITFLIAGSTIVVVTLCDFFYTTLSGNGAGFVTSTCSSLIHNFILLLEKKLGKKVLSVSGMVVTLSILIIWILSVWGGVFLVYSYDPDGIVTSSGESASLAERLYFSGYVLSTLGIGNVKPVTPLFEILTSCFSFFGFIFFTTSMAYLLSVSSAIIQKRSLALAIRNLGENPIEIVQALVGMKESIRYSQITNLQEMINLHSTYYQAYPALHYYHHSGNDVSFGVNLVALDEALSIVLSNNSNSLSKELQLLRGSLNDLLQHLESRYKHKSDEAPEINWNSYDLPDEINKGLIEDIGLKERRKTLSGLLSNENRSWKDVYGK